jgi:hypothetical protein
VSRLSIAVLFILVLAWTSTAQKGAFSEFASPRFARALAMGSAYTGVAEGLEATAYNSAGLADLRHPALAFSYGQGAVFLIDKVSPFDVVFAMPIPGSKIVAGASLSQLNLSDNTYDAHVSCVSLHGAMPVVEGLSAGLDVQYYRWSVANTARDEQNTPIQYSARVTSFDVSPAVLYSKHDFFWSKLRDRLRVGLRLRNALSLRGSISYDRPLSTAEELDRNFQMLTLGASYSLVLPLEKITGKDPISIMVSSDLTRLGNRYAFPLERLNAGVELRLFELLRFWYGRENERALDHSAYSSTPQYPVTRLGVGLSFSPDDLKSLGMPLGIDIAYAYSDWDLIDEKTGYATTRLPMPFPTPTPRHAFSATLTAPLF